MIKPSNELLETLKATASADDNIRAEAQTTLAAALVTPLRQGVMDADTLKGIFVEEMLPPGATAEYPLDYMKPGDEENFAAYTMPKQGKIPERHVEGDVVLVNTYEVANSIDWSLSYARDARWSVVEKAMRDFLAGFVKKNNTDGWRTLLGAADGRGLVVTAGGPAPFTGSYTGTTPTPGTFTKELVSRMKTTMTRGAGGNGNAGKLTDLYLSPEAMEDIRAWDVDDIDEVTRREIFTSVDVAIPSIYGVKLHTLTELGEGQEYDVFLTSVLGRSHGTVASATLKEFCIGLDLSMRDSFVRPIREALQVHMDNGTDFMRRRKAGIFGYMTGGWAALDTRRVLLGEF